MPVGQVKQLWPWFSAPGTRNWVLDNLISGGVVDSNLQYRVEPGRLGNGVALGRDEVFGTFNVENAEFNTTGELPRVRDAQGSVNFHGGDVDIHVTSGRMVVSQGEIATSNATLTIRPEPDVPVIGKLDVDISGPADAVAAVASLRPIRALQRTGLAVSDFSGDVAGHVRTDVPISAGHRRRRSGLAGVAQSRRSRDRQAVRRPVGDRCRRHAGGRSGPGQDRRQGAPQRRPGPDHHARAAEAGWPGARAPGAHRARGPGAPRRWRPASAIC